MTVVEGVTRRGRKLRVVYGEDVETEITIAGQRARILLAHVYRGQVGRTWVTDRGFVRVPYPMGDTLPPAILDGEPVAPTRAEAAAWHRLLAKRLRAFVKAMRRVARAEAGEPPPAGDQSTGMFQTMPPTHAPPLAPPTKEDR